MTNIKKQEEHSPDRLREIRTVDGLEWIHFCKWEPKEEWYITCFVRVWPSMVEMKINTKYITAVRKATSDDIFPLYED